MIVELSDGKFQVRSKKGKPLGTYPSRHQAEERLRQIEMFKSMNANKKAMDYMDYIVRVATGSLG